MSAYLCDNGHISALALYAARAGLPPNVLPREFAPVEEIAEAIARELYAANCASLADRYGDKEQAPFTYEPPSVVKLANHVQVIKAAHCFEYQASEWRGWDESHARQVLRAVIAHAVMSLPGYEKAMWGWPRTERGRVVNPKNATKADLLATIERLQVELHHANAWTFKGLTSAGRKDEWSRRGSVPSETELDALATRGLLKRAKNGATQITTEGRNALGIDAGKSVPFAKSREPSGCA